MKRMGFLMVAAVIAFLLVAFNSGNPVFANSCCGIETGENDCSKDGAKGCIMEVAAGESSGDVCPVCGKASDSKGQQEDVEHGGKTVHLCCEDCANAYNANPDKYSKSQGSKEEHPKSEQPKKKKERGTGYY
jgi:YHS domain-containing protein